MVATIRSYSSPGFSDAPRLPASPYGPTAQPQTNPSAFDARNYGPVDYGQASYQVPNGGQSYDNYGNPVDPNSQYQQAVTQPPQQPQPPSNGSGMYGQTAPGAAPNIYSPPPGSSSGSGAPDMSSFMQGAGGSLQGINNIPAFTGSNGGSGSIEGVGSFTNGSDIPAYQAQLALQGQNTSSVSQMLASLFGSQSQLQSALGTAQIGADTSRYNADQGLAATGLQTGAQRYGYDQNLAGIQAQTAAQQSVAQTNAAAQRYAAEQANVPAQLQNARITGTMVPLFQQLLSQYGPGGGSGSSKYMTGALSSFTPQQEQAALNASDASVERARAQAGQENALHYSGSGYGASSPQVMARNAAIDAASAANSQSGRRQINQDYGQNRSANWISAMNAQQGALNPILSLFGQLLG